MINKKINQVFDADGRPYRDSNFTVDRSDGLSGCQAIAKALMAFSDSLGEGEERQAIFEDMRWRLKTYRTFEKTKRKVILH